MTHFTRITVPLGKDEFQALRENADREYRHPREQARYLLRLALGLDTPNKHESATPALQGNGDLAAIVARLQEMEYAIDGGNSAREDVPASIISDWFRYVWTGETQQ